LVSLSANTKVATIGVNNVLASDFAVTAANSKVVAVQVKDSGMGISTNINALINGQSKITSISQVGPKTPITLSGAQYSAAVNLLGKIDSGTSNLVLSNVLAADVSIVSRNPNVNSYIVTDTATNIVNNIERYNCKISIGPLNDNEINNFINKLFILLIKD
jgi:hypothetical protein